MNWTGEFQMKIVSLVSGGLQADIVSRGIAAHDSEARSRLVINRFDVELLDGGPLIIISIHVVRWVVELTYSQNSSFFSIVSVTATTMASVVVSVAVNF